MEIDIEKEAENLTKYWQLRNVQMEKDREIINLIKPAPKTDEVRWFSNEAKIFYDTCVALLSSYPPRYRLPLSRNFTPEEKDKMNKAERFIMGIFRELDHRQISRGQSYWLREFAYWVLSGWYAIFRRIDRQGKDVKFIADIWDPMTVYPEWDNEKLTRCIRTFSVDKASALTMVYGWKKKGYKLSGEFKEPKDEQVKVINYWLDERGKIYNALQVGDSIVKEMTLEKFKRIPIYTGAIGVPDRITPLWQQRLGENIIAPNRDMFDYENKMISLMATIIAETAYPNIITKTRTGEAAFDSKDLKGYGSQVSLRLEDQVELLKHAATPAEAQYVMSWIARQKQKASFADTVYGGVPQIEISGFALSQYMAAIKYRIAPYLTTMQYVMGDIGRDFLEDYRIGKHPKVNLNTTDPSSLRKGLFFMEAFEPADIPEVSYVDVTIPVTSSVDKTQQILYARQALQPPQLMSRETLWDEILDIQDSEQEYARIIQDEVLELPIVKQIATIEQLRNREKQFRLSGMDAEADAIKTYITALEMQLGLTKSPISGKPGGVPPSMMPPEAINSPDMLRAAVGKPPSGLSRRAQTAEERAESKVRQL